MIHADMIDELHNPTATPVPVVRLEDIWSYDHFADALFAYFSSLKRRNPRYTLNAWAKKLGEKNSGNLVHFFKRRRAPTAEMTERLIAAMHLETREADYFRLLVARARSHSAWAAKQDYQTQIQAYRLAHHGTEIDLKKFETVSSPLHLAVRELVFLRGADSTAEAIQRRLRVSVSADQVQKILEDLTRVGLIALQPDGSYIKIDDFYQTPAEVPSDAIKLYHQRSLNDYIDAIYSVPLEQRHFTSYMLSIPSSQVPEAKKAIEEFMNNFVARFGKSNETCDQVYQLHTLFSPWSKS
jgi:uncharacterized protein (TIGR02147 family)